MKFHQLFKAAIHEPKKLAAFRLLPIGKVFQLCFHFRCVVHIHFIHPLYSRGCSLIRIFAGTSSNMVKQLEGSFIRLHFILQLVISTFYIFIRISIFAICGNLIVKTDEKTWGIPSYVENIRNCDNSSYSSDNRT